MSWKHDYNRLAACFPSENALARYIGVEEGRVQRWSQGVVDEPTADGRTALRDGLARLRQSHVAGSEAVAYAHQLLQTIKKCPTRAAINDAIERAEPVLADLADKIITENL